MGNYSLIIRRYDKLLMMSFIYLFFVSLSIPLNAQKNRILKEYYDLINQAELSIVGDDLESARKYYDQAFKTPYGFPKDIYNALRVSFNLQDTSESISYFNELAHHGLKLEYFSSGFNLAYDSVVSDFYKFISSSHDRIYSIVTQTQMAELAKRVDAFKDQDQNCRRGADTLIPLDICDSLLQLDILGFIDSFGFPGYETIGIMERDRYQPFMEGAFDLMMFHQRGVPDNEFLKRMWEAVEVGELDARAYALRYFCVPCDYYHINIPIDPITESDLQICNKKRSKIYLEPLEDYYKKIEFQRAAKKKTEYVLVGTFSYLFNGENRLIIRD